MLIYGAKDLQTSRTNNSNVRTLWSYTELNSALSLPAKIRALALGSDCVFTKQVVHTPSSGCPICKSLPCIHVAAANQTRLQCRNVPKPQWQISWKKHISVRVVGAFVLICTKNAFRFHQIYRNGAWRVGVCAWLLLMSRFQQTVAKTYMKHHTVWLDYFFKNIHEVSYGLNWLQVHWFGTSTQHG